MEQRKLCPNMAKKDGPLQWFVNAEHQVGFFSMETFAKKAFEQFLLEKTLKMNPNSLKVVLSKHLYLLDLSLPILKDFDTLKPMRIIEIGVRGCGQRAVTYASCIINHLPNANGLCPIHPYMQNSSSSSTYSYLGTCR